MLSFAGCLELKQVAQPIYDEVDASAPFAVLSMSPIASWEDDARTILTSNRRFGLSEDDFDTLLEGIDLDRPAAAIMYLNEGIPEPVLYLPLADYDDFKNSLDHVFGLRRAATNTFYYGHYRIKAKQVGDYAVLGVSIDGLNHSPGFPEEFVNEKPADIDWQFKMMTQEVHRKEQRNIFRALKNSLGEEFAQLAKDNLSFTVGLNLDANHDLGIQAEINPLPKDPERIQELLKGAIGEKWALNTNVQNDKLMVQVDLPMKKVGAAWRNVKPVLQRAFDLHLSVIAVQSTRADVRFNEENGDTSVFNQTGNTRERNQDENSKPSTLPQTNR